MTGGSDRFCVNCGVAREERDRFCVGCGAAFNAPKTDSSQPALTTNTSSETAPTQDKQRVWPWVLVLLLVGAAVGYVWQGRPSSPPSRAVPAPATASESPSASVAPTPMATSLTASQAAKFGAARAERELSALRREGRKELKRFHYRWIPQVSSKCKGLLVDIKPRWTADGNADTDSVTVPQILAFHLALAQRFDAFTVYDKDISVNPQDLCTGRRMWFSLVPKSFASSGRALKWCRKQGFPEGECGARFVVPTGKPGTDFVWRW